MSDKNFYIRGAQPKDLKSDFKVLDIVDECEGLAKERIMDNGNTYKRGDVIVITVPARHDFEVGEAGPMRMADLIDALALHAADVHFKRLEKMRKKKIARRRRSRRTT